MPQILWHYFLSQLSMHFQMVCSILLTVLHLKTMLLIAWGILFDLIYRMTSSASFH